MKNRVKQYKFTKYILHTIAAQIRLSFNHLIKEPWSPSIFMTKKNIWRNKSIFIVKVRQDSYEGFTGYPVFLCKDCILFTCFRLLESTFSFLVCLKIKKDFFIHEIANIEYISSTEKPLILGWSTFYSLH